jgi:hypothetical protein
MADAVQACQRLPKMTKHAPPFTYADLKLHVFAQHGSAVDCAPAQLHDDDQFVQAYLAVTAGTQRPRNHKRRRQTLPEKAELRKSLWEHRDNILIDTQNAETFSQRSAEQQDKHASSSPTTVASTLRLLSPRDLKQVLLQYTHFALISLFATAI